MHESPMRAFTCLGHTPHTLQTHPALTIHKDKASLGRAFCELCLCPVHTPPTHADLSSANHEVKANMGRAFRELPTWTKALVAWGALSAAWVVGQLLFWAVDTALLTGTAGMKAEDRHARPSERSYAAGECGTQEASSVTRDLLLTLSSEWGYAAGERGGTQEASVARELLSTLSSVTAHVRSTLLRWASHTEQALTRCDQSPTQQGGPGFGFPKSALLWNRPTICSQPPGFITPMMRSSNSVSLPWRLAVASSAHFLTSL